MVTNLNLLARDIIKNNQYMTIGSADKTGDSWVSPVVYAYDKSWNFYFVSLPNSKHSVNIIGGNGTSLAIFDSHQPLGEGIGLQIEGKIKELGLIDIPNAAAIYFTRNYPFGEMRHTFNEALKKFLERKVYRFYKVTPTKVWMNNPNSEIDERVEINLNQD